MWTIFGKGFAHAQVHTNHSTSSEGTIKCFDVCMSACAKPLSKTSPYGQIAFPTRSCITIYSSNLFKKDESTCLALWVNDTL